jgi:tetratricopeptide (TPR) repeat protein
MADVHYDLANTYLNLSQEDRAIEHYTKAIDLSKPQMRVEYFFNLGNALSLKQRFGEAIQ